MSTTLCRRFPNRHLFSGGIGCIVKQWGECVFLSIRMLLQCVVLILIHFWQFVITRILPFCSSIRKCGVDYVV